MNEVTTGDRIAIIIIFALAPLTGVLLNWVAALAACAFGLMVALFASAGALARAHDERMALHRKGGERDAR